MGAEVLRRPAWATAIGVISVVFGSLGVICTPVNLVMQQRNPAMKAIFEHAPEWFRAYVLVSQAIGIVMALWLLAAGVLLLGRKPSAGLTHVAYSSVSLVMTVVGTAVTAVAMSSGTMPENVAAPAQFGLCIGMVIGPAYPVFLLIWFMRRKIRQEMASWRSGPV